MVNMTDFSRNNTIRDNWSNNSASALAGVQRQFNTYLEPQIEGAEQLSQSLDNLIQPFLNRERDEVIKNKMIEKSAASKAKADSRALELTKQLSKYDIQDAVMDNADINSMEKFNMPLDQVQRNLDNIARGYGFSSKEALMGALNSEYNGDTRLTKVKKDSNLLGYIEEYKSIMKDYDRTRDGNLNSKDLLNIATTLTAKHPTSTLESNMKYLQEVLGSQSEASGSINSLITKLESENMYNNQELYGDTNYGSGKSNNTQNTNPLIKRTNSSSNTNISNTEEYNDPLKIVENGNVLTFNPTIDAEIVRKNEKEANSLIESLKTDTGSYFNNKTQNLLRKYKLQKPIEDALKSENNSEAVSKLNEIKEKLNSKKSQVLDKLNSETTSTDSTLNSYFNKWSNISLIENDPPLIENAISEIDKVIDILNKDSNNSITNKTKYDFFREDYVNESIKIFKNILNNKDVTNPSISSQRSAIENSSINLNNAIKNGIAPFEVDGKYKKIYLYKKGSELDTAVGKLDPLKKSYANMIMYGITLLNGGPDEGNSNSVEKVMTSLLPIIQEIPEDSFTGNGFLSFEKKINSALSKLNVDGPYTLGGSYIDITKLANFVKGIFSSNATKNEDKIVLRSLNTREYNSDDSLRSLVIMRRALASMGASNKDFQISIDSVKNKDTNK